jgi:hypothetical protein
MADENAIRPKRAYSEVWALSPRNAMRTTIAMTTSSIVFRFYLSIDVQIETKFPVPPWRASRS